MIELKRKLEREYMASQEVEGLLADLIENLIREDKNDDVSSGDLKAIHEAMKKISLGLDNKEKSIKILSESLERLEIEDKIPEKESEIEKEYLEVKETIRRTSIELAKDVEKIKEEISSSYEDKKKYFQERKEMNDGDFFKNEKELVKDIAKEARSSLDTILDRIEEEYSKSSVTFEEMEEELKEDNKKDGSQGK